MQSRNRSALWASIALLAVVPTRTDAAFDPTKTPLVEAALERYQGGVLEPVAVLGDTTNWDVDSFGTGTKSFFHDLAVEGTWLFAAAGRAFEIYNISNPDTASLSGRKVAEITLPFWGSTDNGGSFFLKSIAVAPGNSNLVAAGVASQGFSVWNTTSKAVPGVHYQDSSINATRVHVTNAAGRTWAFVGDIGGSGGLKLYDMTSAAGFNRCLDSSQGRPCTNVYKGEVGSLAGATTVAGAGDFVVVGSAPGARNVTIFDVTNPGTATANPITKLSGQLPFFARDLTLWQGTNGTYYLGAIEATTVYIYNVDCITSAPGCSSIPSPLSTTVASDPGGPQGTITVSFDAAARPYLYIGNDRRSGCHPQREFLLDVSNPSVPTDITPHVHASGYWGWYYSDCDNGAQPGGFNNIKPWRARFHGNVLYRAAHSGLDSHRLVGASPPVSNFFCSPTGPFVGETVNCTDTSTGAPDQWSWTFQDATPSTSTLENPSVVFNSVGAKQVTLIATNPSGPSGNTALATINVVDPAPAVSGVDADVTSVLVCSQVTFSAVGVTGQTPLTFDWEVKDTGSMVTASGMGTPFIWSIPPSQAPGDYTATVTVDNAVGPPAMATSPTVTVVALPALAFSGPPTHDAFTGSTVQFHIDATGATEWNWDFGDGASTGWITDPVAGPNPIHTYTVSGNYDVSLQIRNCVEAAINSAVLNIDVTVEPLNILNFQAVCSFGFCLFDTGQSITFQSPIDGTPKAYDYDWDGDSDYEETSATPITKHTYCSAGSFEPVLRVRRGLDQDVLADTNSTALTVGVGTACSAPAAPTGLVAVVQGNALALAWSDLASDEDGYRVLRSADDGAGFFPVATLPVNSNGYLDDDIEIDLTYTYRVQVFSEEGTADSNDAMGTLSTDIFADGFEAGDLSSWTGTVPPESAVGKPDSSSD